MSAERISRLTEAESERIKKAPGEREFREFEEYGGRPIYVLVMPQTLSTKSKESEES